jgi:hypothetical protein
MPRTLVASLALVGVLSSPAIAFAQQGPIVATVATALPSDSSAPAAVPSLVPPSHLQLQRSSVITLSASLVSLQAYDTYSTLSALKLGGTETNPLMQGVVKHPAALILLKGGVAAGSIFAATRLWQQHHRGAAIALLAMTNGTIAVVAAHNASVLRTMRADGN